MRVADLIAVLQRLPPGMQVHVPRAPWNGPTELGPLGWVLVDEHVNVVLTDHREWRDLERDRVVHCSDLADLGHARDRAAEKRAGGWEPKRFP